MPLTRMPSALPPLSIVALLACAPFAADAARPAERAPVQQDAAASPSRGMRAKRTDPVLHASVPPGAVLQWADEFDAANLGHWVFETGGHGWGNNELQYYTGGQNAFLQYDPLAASSVLVIEARRGAPAGATCWYGSCAYSSSRMVTRGARSFQYGRIEARIRLPQTQGIWPAFWMLGDNLGEVGWPQSGEIDIMEHVGSEPTLTHGALHGPGYSGNTPFSGTHDLRERADANYHVYAVEWDAGGIRWFVDDTLFYGVTRAQVQARGPWVFDQPFFLLLNVAVGGNWPGSPDAGSTFPQRMYVDYVRVYRLPPANAIRRNGSQPLAPPAAQASTVASARPEVANPPVPAASPERGERRRPPPARYKSPP